MKEQMNLFMGVELVQLLSLCAQKLTVDKKQLTKCCQLNFCQPVNFLPHLFSHFPTNHTFLSGSAPSVFSQDTVFANYTMAGDQIGNVV